VAVRGNAYALEQGLNYWNSESQVWDKVIVHNIEVNPIGVIGNSINFGGQTG